jgi:arylsulfatase A-like enzyme
MGLVELGLYFARIQIPQQGITRKSPHILWMIPLTNLALFGSVGLLLAMLVRPIPRVGGRLCAWLLCTLALLVPFSTIPGLRATSCLVLAAGLSCWITPTILGRVGSFRRLVLASLPPLGLALLALGWIAIGRDGLATRSGSTTGTAPPGAPNVLFVVMDTVRADATSLDGSDRDTTPNLASLARRGARFERAISTAPWTLPSHASMFTGRWPWELAVGPYRALDSRHPTLAEYLGRHGYATAGFAANVVFCTAEYGLARGFGHYEDFVVSPLEALRSSGLGGLICHWLVSPLDRLCIAAGREASHPLESPYYRKDASEVNRAALGWIAEHRDRPFFAFLNYMDAHDPYLVPEGAAHPFSRRPPTLAERRVLRNWIDETPGPRDPEEIRLARDSYKDCLAYLDGQIGRLLAELGRLGQLDNTVIVITSDHGEHFGEHVHDGYPILGHHQSVYQQEIHVPLIVVAPGRLPAGLVVTGTVSLRDLPSTVVDLTGLQEGSPFPGHSLLTPAAGGTLARDRVGLEAALAEFLPEERSLPFKFRYNRGAVGLMRVVVTDDNSYHSHGDGHEEFYDLVNDPRESINLSRSKKIPVALDPLRLSRSLESPVALDPFRAKLHALTSPDRHGDRAVRLRETTPIRRPDRSEDGT